MIINFDVYSYKLRQLCEDYYYNNLSYVEYKALRTDLFDQIDAELILVNNQKIDNSQPVTETSDLVTELDHQNDD